ncbi:hypothetical protein [Pontibacter sp. SGAir0037]|uniref:hypothetical protein n=1 Tax=Pontibacter sp. SGAir0037 TaxID=2571030 RepID=UPI0010CCDF2C|nr:hypothetical protein [Pontibacter sp. SGAir0037]QCR22274.1 hypothetical protein C1N53_07940 [Pontibacter sp. SGAir0037]
MRTSLFSIFLATGLFSCNSNTGEAHKTSASGQQPDEQPVKRCFQSVSGNQHQDTAWVQLEIKEENITGYFTNQLFEKDARRGTIQGSRKGNEIKATWTFSQEGRQDTLPVHFKLENNKLFQKPYSYNSATGREFIADSSSYAIRFDALDCSALAPAEH